MTIKDLIEVLTGVVLVCTAAWLIVQLVRDRHDLPLRVLVPGVTLLAVVVTLRGPFEALEPIDEALGKIVFSNLAWLSMAFCFAAFFVLADDRRPERIRKKKVLIELGLLVAALGIMYLNRATAPPDTWHTPRLPEDYRSWRNAVEYLSVDGYALAVWSVGALRGIRYLKRLEHPWARVALGMVIAGTAGMAIGVDAVSLVRQVLYIVYPGSRWPALSTVYNAGRLGGQILLVAGLALTPLATFVVDIRSRYDRLRRWRYRRQMAPLWRTLCGEFPYVVLPAQPEGDGAGDDVIRDFERTTTEITDGLAALAPYAPHLEANPADPSVAAEVVSAALQTRADGREQRWAGEAPEPATPPYPQIEPDFENSWQRRAQWMVALSRALERQGAIPPARKEKTPDVAAAR